MRTTEPDDLADALGIRIVRQRLRTAAGLWIPDGQIIILDTRLTRIERRCVLQHELIHAQAGHRFTRALYPRLESWTRKETAQELIDPAELADLQAWRPDSPDRWCRELRVTPTVLRDYLNTSPGTCPHHSD